MVSRGLLEMEYSLWHCVARFCLEISHASNQNSHNLMAHDLISQNLSLGAHNSHPRDDGVVWST
jgi:hypothetical protein